MAKEEAVKRFITGKKESVKNKIKLVYLHHYKNIKRIHRWICFQCSSVIGIFITFKKKKDRKILNSLPYKCTNPLKKKKKFMSVLLVQECMDFAFMAHASC